MGLPGAQTDTAIAAALAIALTAEHTRFALVERFLDGQEEPKPFNMAVRQMALLHFSS